MRTKQKESNRKVVLGILFILLALILAFGMIFAYFSDIVETAATATAGTLDITGDTKLYLNGSSTALSGTTVANFNPGDVLVVKGNIENEGNKSAWIRDIIDISSSDSAIKTYIEIYAGEVTKAQIDASSVTPITLSSDKFTSTAKIINGQGTAAETETGANTLGSHLYESAYTVYFKSTAANAAQGKNVSFEVKTQAMQYRNNPTPVWTDVVTSAFGS